MSLIKFNQLISESGDLQLLHTAANISAPKIHHVENGSHVAVHKTTTGEHADWLKGRFEKALNHNPSKKHIKVEVHHDGDNHEVHITHTPPKEVKESAGGRFNGRDAAEHGVVHPTHAQHMKVGETHDFYHPKNGDKVQGKVVHNDGKTVAIAHGGVHHKLKVATTYPGMDLDEELNEGEQKYNVGDHVHLRSSFRGMEDKPKKHGVVGKASERTAEVHWEDGTKSKHLHTSGKRVGENSMGYVDHIRHNELHDPDKPGYTFKRVSNDEHKAHIAKVAAAEKEKRDHRDSHLEAISKLTNTHHTQLKPHHLQAIHDILDRAKAGHD